METPPETREYIITPEGIALSARLTVDYVETVINHGKIEYY
jgi:hypothetical protein